MPEFDKFSPFNCAQFVMMSSNELADKSTFVPDKSKTDNLRKPLSEHIESFDVNLKLKLFDKFKFCTAGKLICVASKATDKLLKAKFTSCRLSNPVTGMTLFMNVLTTSPYSRHHMALLDRDTFCSLFFLTQMVLPNMELKLLVITNVCILST